jgi:hypothetical protein
MKVEYKTAGEWRLFAYAGTLVVVMDYVRRLERQGFMVRVTSAKGDVIQITGN